MIIKAIALNSFKEAIRSKTLFVTFAVALIFLCASLVLEDLSLGQQDAIMVNLTAATTSFVVVMTTLLTAAFHITSEMHRNTLHSILAKGVTRTQFLLGKFISLLILNAVLIVILGIISTITLKLQAIEIPTLFITANLLLFYKTAIMSAVVLFFATLLRPVLTIFASIIIFFIAHSSQELYIATLDPKGTLISKVLNTVVHYVIPHFDALNMKTFLLHQVPQSPIQTLQLTGYTMTYIAVVLLCATQIFSKKQL